MSEAFSLVIQDHKAKAKTTPDLKLSFVGRQKCILRYVNSTEKPMTTAGRELVNIALSCENEIIELIKQQAEWEIPLHVVLYRELQKRGHKPKREAQYPRKGLKRLDILFVYDGAHYAVEVKVESASRPGQIAHSSFATADGDFSTAITEQVASDISKVTQFHAYDYGDPSSVSRNLVMLVGYSLQAQDLMTQLSTDVVANDFGQGGVTFNHKGANVGRNTRVNGAKITVGVYQADHAV